MAALALESSLLAPYPESLRTTESHGRTVPAFAWAVILKRNNCPPRGYLEVPEDHFVITLG